MLRCVTRNINKDERCRKIEHVVGNAVSESFMDISPDYIRNVSHFMCRCCIAVLKRKVDDQLLILNG